MAHYCRRWRLLVFHHNSA